MLPADARDAALDAGADLARRAIDAGLCAQVLITLQGGWREIGANAAPPGQHGATDDPRAGLRRPQPASRARSRKECADGFPPQRLVRRRVAARTRRAADGPRLLDVPVVLYRGADGGRRRCSIAARTVSCRCRWARSSATACSAATTACSSTRRPLPADPGAAADPQDACVRAFRCWCTGTWSGSGWATRHWPIRRRVRQAAVGAPGWTLNVGPYTHVKANYGCWRETCSTGACELRARQHARHRGDGRHPVEISQHDDAILVSRWTPDSPAAPILQRYGRASPATSIAGSTTGGTRRRSPRWTSARTHRAAHATTRRAIAACGSGRTTS